jgi:hypothetical protein
MLRAEVGVSSNAAMGVNTVDQYNLLLSRVQKRLWSDHEWPWAVINRDEPLLENERFYSFPDDLDFDRVTNAWVKYNNIWHPLEYGIGPAQYNTFDSDRAIGTTPTVRWQHYENDQFEVWPTPTANGQSIRLRGVKKLPQLISDTDTAELDDVLIVLFAASEILSRNGATDAPMKMAQATSHYNKLKGLALKNDRFVYGGGLDKGDRLRIIGGRFVRDDRLY